MGTRLQWGAHSGGAVGARGTAAWPDHNPGMLLPFLGGGTPQLLGPLVLPSHSGDAPRWPWPLGFGSYPQPQPSGQVQLPSGVLPGPPEPSQGHRQLCKAPSPSRRRGRAGALGHNPARFHLRRSRSGQQQEPPRPGEQGSVPHHPPLPRLFPCSQGCTSRSTAESSACPCMLPGQYIYRRERYIYIYAIMS